MKPGKHPTPASTLDLKKLWRDLNEDPPGPIVTLGEGLHKSDPHRERPRS